MIVFPEETVQQIYRQRKMPICVATMATANGSFERSQPVSSRLNVLMKTTCVVNSKKEIIKRTKEYARSQTLYLRACRYRKFLRRGPGLSAQRISEPLTARTWESTEFQKFNPCEKTNTVDILQSLPYYK